MDITFNILHAFSPASTPDEDAHALRSLLDCMVQLNLGYLRRHPTKALYRSGVFYKRTTIWEPIPALYARGFGDCKSLSAALIAEYMLKGIACAPVFRWVRQPDGRKDFHILVMLPDGNWEDPSKTLGMNQSELAYFDLR